ncbi:MAG: ABC transporter ATP-binding protein [Candidatus Eisenbacteria bacterium]|uniref:ABC transporter ATP-binding protein n=1 Tax=Eiseniibacteriota bacterium TaxID=2212470 RepID=A0A538SSD2_UNCEI|nr:MAG: ABC transporter ATP-binding protein [Candidatus Eisenbacteria bacterium]
MIHLRDVHKVYYRDRIEVPVLQGINLDVHEVEFLALMGPSGSGKSTLLNLIAGIDAPTKGEVRVAGESLGTLKPSRLAAWRARHIGFIFQLYNLIPVLTAYQNVELPLLLTRLSSRERKKRVLFALGLVGLEGRAKHFPRQLSGGEEQRVAIARAIVADPTLLVADEPTGDLDAKNAAEILTLLKRLNEELKKTVLMVTHDPHAAERAHLIYHLDKGVLQS